MNKRGQVWVETVVYLLIGISIIGVLLALIQPKINAAKDKIVIEQSRQVLSELDEQINALIFLPAGNSRQFQIKISKGKLVIDGSRDEIKYLIEQSKYPFSQLGEEVAISGFKVLTEKKGSNYRVSFSKQYAINITAENKDAAMEFTQGAVAHEVVIETNGIINGKTNINIR